MEIEYKKIIESIDNDDDETTGGMFEMILDVHEKDDESKDVELIDALSQVMGNYNGLDPYQLHCVALWFFNRYSHPSYRA